VGWKLSPDKTLPRGFLRATSRFDETEEHRRGRAVVDGCCHPSTLAARMRQHCSLCLASVFMFVLPVSRYSCAEQFIPSSISAILNATTPIMTILVATRGYPPDAPDRGR
jgi:drug/metabolite transporter (DMT)-like permease